MLTKGLQSTKLSENTKSTLSPIHPGVNRNTSGGARNGLGERGVSSTSLGREKIDEEQGLFSMEEEEAEGKQ